MDKNFIKKTWDLMGPFHNALIFIFIITAIFETVRLLGPYIFGKILDLLIQTKGLLTPETALTVIAGLAGIRIISMLIDYATDICIESLLWRSEKHIATQTFNKMLELSMDYHEQENTGTKIALVNKGTDKLIDLIGRFTWEFQPICLQLIVTVVLMFLNSWPMGIIFLLSMIPFLLITFGMFHKTRDLRTARYDAYELSSGEIGDTISNITVVKAFAQEQRERDSFRSIWEKIVGIYKDEYKTHVIASFFRSLLVEVFYITLLIIGVFEIRAGHLTVGTLVFLISLVERAYSNVYRLGRIYNHVADAMEPVNRISKLMNTDVAVKNVADPIFPKTIEGGISFKSVSFGYHKREVLKDLNFEIQAGSFTALVGKSGSGKSTIVKLISRYYDPTSGDILIDNKLNLKNLDLDFYRRQTAVVFQDSPVPDREIWQIISYSGGKKDFNDVKKEVVEASKLAHSHEFIMDFEEGYRTQVGERGVKLSGGQKQRLAIARALFARPRILIMDEPTSHLDTVSEHMIQESLKDLSKERSFTKIIIAHRLSTVQHADQILVMEDGRLQERGTHRELLLKNGVYSKIVRQSEVIKS